MQEKLNFSSLSPEEREDLRANLEEASDGIKDARQNLKDLKEELKDTRSDFEMEKEAFAEWFDDLMDDFSQGGEYYSYFKKPTKKVLLEVVTELNKQVPNWEDQKILGKGDWLAGSLKETYPDLVKKNAPRGSTCNRQGSAENLSDDRQSKTSGVLKFLMTVIFLFALALVLLGHFLSASP